MPVFLFISFLLSGINIVFPLCLKKYDTLYDSLLIEGKKITKVKFFCDRAEFEKLFEEYFAAKIIPKNDSFLVNKNNITEQIRPLAFIYGFLSIKVDSVVLQESENGFVLNTYVALGDRYKLFLNLISDSNDYTTIMVKSKLSEANDELCDLNEIQDIFSAALQIAVDNGYAFAKLTIASIEINDSLKKAILYLNLDKGSRCFIDTLTFSGSFISREDFLIQRSRIKIGEEFCEKKLKNAAARIYMTGYYDKAEYVDYYLIRKEDRIIGAAKFNIIERKNNFVDGIVGFRSRETSPNYFNQNESKRKLEISGFLTLGFGNLFGRGINLNLIWNKLQRDFNETQAEFKHYNFFSYPFNLGLSIQQRSSLKQYTLFSYDIEFESYVYKDLLGAVRIASKATTYARTFENEKNYNSKQYSISGILRYDSFNDLFFPTNGEKLVIQTEYCQKKYWDFTLNGYEITTLSKYETSIQIIREVFANNAVFFNATLKKLESNFWDEADLFYFGGFSSVRGYNENQFSANVLFYSNFEYRIKLSKDIIVFGFYDSGYYIRKENIILNILKDKGYVNGFGLGMSLKTAAGFLRINYGLTEKVSFDKGKLSFGITAAF